MKKKTNLALVAVLLCSAVLMSLFGSCSKEHKRADLDIDRLHNIFVSSESMLRTSDSLLALGEISEMVADFYKIEFYKSDAIRSREITDSALRLPIKNNIDRFYYFLIGSLQVEQDFILRRYEQALQEAQKYIGSVNMDEVNSHYLLQTAYTLTHNIMARSNIMLERFDEAEKQMQTTMELIDQFEKQNPDDSKIKNNWDTKRTQFSVGMMVEYANMRQWNRSLTWAERAEKYLKIMADNPEGGKASYTTASMNIMGVKSFALEKMGRHEEAAQAYAEYLKNPLSGSTIGKVNAVSYLNAAKRYAEAEQNINNIEDVLRQMGMKMDMVNIVGLVRGKFVAHLGAGHRDSALAVATRIIEGLDSAEVWAQFGQEETTVLPFEDRDLESSLREALGRIEGSITEAEITDDDLIQESAGSIPADPSVRNYSFTEVNGRIYFRENSRMDPVDLPAVNNIQLQQNNYQLTIAKARAEESSHMKTDFIQQISHEIRTPLNILSGFTQVLTTNGMDLDDETRQDINRQVVENTDRITELVNKMLELSDINSRTVLEMTDQISVMQIAAEAIDASAIGEAEHLTFDFKPGDGAETTVITTNHQAAVRALTLLLDNARKFTAPAEALGNNEPADNKQRALLSVNVVDGKVQFVVEDTGIGVPAAEAEHIFDEFVQLNEYYDGTGIGLTVARSLARRLGGDIVLDTTYTQGARFVMTLA